MADIGDGTGAFEAQAASGIGGTIQVGDISNVKGVAIGPGATAYSLEHVQVYGDLHVGPKVTTQYSDPERLQLKMLVDRVKHSWIENVLWQTVHQVALIDLGVAPAQHAIDHPQERYLKLPDAAPHALPPNKSIATIFDDTSRLLLILGEAGSGKTITLLSLAERLIARFERDEALNHPAPAYFNLSTWTRDTTLMEWLVAELSEQYSIGRNSGRKLLEKNRLILLLDGLDEVREAHRADCIDAINTFGSEVGVAGLAVCSRLNEYAQLPSQLRLFGAIRLNPLSPAQIDTYLDQAGAHLAALREVLQEDRQLQALATTPLMLNVMSLAYKDLAVQELKGSEFDTIVERRGHLFQTYISRMLGQKHERDKPTSDAQLLAWLSWLAYQMTRHYHSSFLLERLQPSWLARRLWRWLYVLSTRLGVGFIGGVIGGLIIGSVNALDPGTSIGAALGNGLIEGLLGGLSGGLAVTVVDIIKFERQRKVAATKPSLSRRQILAYTLTIGVASWLAVVVAFALLVDDAAEGVLVGVLVALSFSTIFGAGMFFGARSSRQGYPYDIQTVEYLNWARRGAVRGGVYGLFLGLGIGLIMGLIDAQTSLSSPLTTSIHLAGLNVVVAVSLIAGSLFTLFGLIQGGLRGVIVEPGDSDRPNQGMRLTLRNALRVGLLFGVGYGLLGLLIGVILGRLANQMSLLFIYIMYGLFFGVIAALWYGGLEVVKHYCLRLLLYFEKDTPFPPHYRAFLDYASRVVFLRNTGRGYIFIHRLLQEHFANMHRAPDEPAL